MNVILAVVGEIVVDDVLNVLDTGEEKRKGGKSAAVSTRGGKREERGGNELTLKKVKPRQQKCDGGG